MSAFLEMVVSIVMGDPQQLDGLQWNTLSELMIATPMAWTPPYMTFQAMYPI